MPDRPFSVVSTAVAVSVSPKRTGARKLIVLCCATVAELRELHAKAKALSASMKVTPPWPMPWPLQ